MPKLDEIVRAGLSRVDTIRVVRTAVNPLLWLVGLTVPLFLLAAVLIDDRPVRLLLIGLAALLVLPALVAYFILLFRDPDRLQSEEYRIRLQELRFRYRKGRRPVAVERATETGRIGYDRGETK
ncbi:hypothetical protein A33M_0102 [Rhodovulum sp. PH10]|uniref:hypothetical protein n=1 Tax=Rhodovulum sp. PH10 TaxID=1187851 RepID=UPI00027C1DB5|nr:hypothetical protein [Rhodovulum sp. PH10]EJW13245.1 hypothetical protein A33M_0102 [Rhodovulum sp. PH10]